MANLYLEKAASPGRVKEFLIKRIARVAPLYLLIVLASYLSLEIFAANIPGTALTNETLLPHLLFLRGYDVLWTVPVEVQFYMLFPLIWIAAPYPPLLIIGLLAALLLPFLPSAGNMPQLFQTVDLFALGICVAKLYRLLTPRMADLLFVICVALYIPLFPLMRPFFGFEAESFEAIWRTPSLILLVTILLAASCTSPIAAKVLGNRPVRYVGTVSYSLYLLHYSATAIAQRWALPEPVEFVMFLFLAVSMATISFFLIERPLKNLVIRLAQRPHIPLTRCDTSFQ